MLSIERNFECNVISILTVFFICLFTAKISFEKMTNRDYSGTTYYTIRNVSLYECLGWCRDEVDCTSASFNFVVNPLAPVQETSCKLQNETLVNKAPTSNIGPSALASASSGSPQKAINSYFFSKLHLRSGKHVFTF